MPKKEATKDKFAQTHLKKFAGKTKTKSLPLPTSYPGGGGKDTGYNKEVCVCACDSQRHTGS